MILSIGQGFFKLQNKSRRRKLDLFMSIFHPGPSDKILDLGGAEGTYFKSRYSWPDKVTIIDLNYKALIKLNQ